MRVCEGSTATFCSLGLYYWELNFSREINIDISMMWVYSPCLSIIILSICHMEPIEQLFSVQNGSANCFFHQSAFQKCSPVTTLDCD